jgi:hypothetical protein
VQLGEGAQLHRKHPLGEKRAPNQARLTGERASRFTPQSIRSGEKVVRDATHNQQGATGAPRCLHRKASARREVVRDAATHNQGKVHRGEGSARGVFAPQSIRLAKVVRTLPPTTRARCNWERARPGFNRKASAWRRSRVTLPPTNQGKVQIRGRAPWVFATAKHPPGEKVVRRATHNQGKVG